VSSEAKQNGFIELKAKSYRWLRVSENVA